MDFCTLIIRCRRPETKLELGSGKTYTSTVATIRGKPIKEYEENTSLGENSTQ